MESSVYADDASSRRASHNDRVLAAMTTMKAFSGLVLKHLFHARGSDGRDYEVHVYVEPAHADNAWIERIAKVCLADGGELRVLSHRHYEIVASGVRLESADREAI